MRTKCGTAVLPLFLNRNRPSVGRWADPPHQGPSFAMMRPSVRGTEEVRAGPLTTRALPYTTPRSPMEIGV